jgi:hypothetical protein
MFCDPVNPAYHMTLLARVQRLSASVKVDAGLHFTCAFANGTSSAVMMFCNLFNFAIEPFESADALL